MLKGATEVEKTKGNLFQKISEPQGLEKRKNTIDDLTRGAFPSLILSVN